MAETETWTPLTASSSDDLVMDIRRVSWNLYTWRIVIGNKRAMGRGNRRNMKLATSNFLLRNGGVTTPFINEDLPGGRTEE